MAAERAYAVRSAPSYARQRVSTSTRVEKRVRRRRQRTSYSFDDGGDPLADADAHRRQAVVPAGPTQLVRQHRDQPCSAHSQRMTQRDRTAVDIDLFLIQAELVDADDRLRGERLVE